MQTSPSLSTLAPVRVPVFSEPRLPFKFDEKGFPIPVDGLRVTEEILSVWPFAAEAEYDGKTGEIRL